MFMGIGKEARTSVGAGGENLPMFAGVWDDWNGTRVYGPFTIWSKKR